jgi:hypothetical protein
MKLKNRIEWARHDDNVSVGMAEHGSLRRARCSEQDQSGGDFFI